MSDRNAYGGIFHARFEYVRERHGTKGLDALLASMRDRGFAGPFSVEEFKLAKKYPLEGVLHFIDGYLELFGEEEFKRMSREIAKRKGVVGFFVKWASSPELLLTNAGNYWPRFYDFGSLEGEVMAPGKGRVRGFDVSPSGGFCRSLTGYFTGIVENAVDRVSVSHTMCVHEGDDVCEWRVEWN